jgi:CPA2 family monovalent cation:H+ antiporter-2
LNTALTVAASLAQIGEFSFILAALGMSLGLLPSEGQQLILAGAIVSIALNPLVFRGIEPLQRLLMERSSAARRHAMRDDPLAGLPADVSVERLTAHAVVTGYGRVGKPVVDALRDAGETVVVIEENRELVDQMRRDGQLAVAGDAAEPEALIQGHVARARFLIIATPDATRSRRMVDIARRLNPRIHVVARAHSEFEAAHLRADGADRVFIGEVELAGAMVAHVTGTVGSIRPS